MENKTLIIQFNNDLFWGYKVEIEYSTLENLLIIGNLTTMSELKGSYEKKFDYFLENLTRYCIAQFKIFLEKHNLMALYHKLCMDEKYFKIYHNKETPKILEKIFKMVIFDNKRIDSKEVMKSLYQLGHKIYIG